MPKSIPHVSDYTSRRSYDRQMPATNDSWKAWGKRLRVHLKESDSSLAKLAEKMDLSEPTLRSWTNGNREINLSDFFLACRHAKADPAQILFGQPLMSDDVKKKIGALAVSVLEADPAANPDYGDMITKIKRDVRKRGPDA